MIPEEIGEATLQIRRYEKDVNDNIRRFDLNVVEEKREVAQIQILKAINRMISDYNKKVKNNPF